MFIVVVLMACSRVCLAILGLFSAGSAQAVAPSSPRLPLSLRGLDGGTEVVYHPHRWLTIRRGIVYVRAQPANDIVRSGGQAVRRPRAYAMTGDIHPFGDGFRVSMGLREDDNRRLLRGSNDRSDTGTARYAPLVTVGVAGTVADGLKIGGDVGLVGRSRNRAGDSLLVTPADMMASRGDDERGYRPVVQLSASYRFRS